MSTRLRKPQYSILQLLQAQRSLILSRELWSAKDDHSEDSGSYLMCDILTLIWMSRHQTLGKIQDQEMGLLKLGHEGGLDCWKWGNREAGSRSWVLRSTRMQMTVQQSSIIEWPPESQRFTTCHICQVANQSSTS